MGKIVILDEQVANLIAAGEVVERPASVVKELVENSIDAGSTKIEVHVKEGGLKQIAVKDNGSGLEKEDAELAFHRHATSKIRQGRDLFRIKTLGFRGEALPSIAAVSRLTLTTNAVESEPGLRLVYEGGKLLRREETAFPVGTEVSVSDLFYNTPARLKYMKSISTEISHVSDVVNRLALAHPEIAFTLYHEDRQLLKTLGDGRLLHVIAAIYGASAAKQMIPVQIEDLDFRVTGYLSKPELTRANRSYITTLVNGRTIRNQSLNQAILEGYRTLLMLHRYPLVVLNLSMDPTLVDVNVHPAKLEVRFSKEKELVQLIRQGIENAFKTTSLAPRPVALAKTHPNPAAGKQNHDTNRRAYSHSVQEELSLPSTPVWTEGQPEKEASKLHYALPPKDVQPIRESDAAPETVSRRHDPFDHGDWPLVKTGEREKNGERLHPDISGLQPLAQVHGTYIVAQNEKGLFLIDQHAAHERVFFEKISRALKHSQIVRQELLVPIRLDVRPGEVDLILERRERFESLGITIEHFGGQTLLIRSYPQWVSGDHETEALESIIQMVASDRLPQPAELYEKTAALMACKAAIKANRHLRREEMEALLAELAQMDNPYTCPHGRPVLVHFTTHDIEKMFKRVI